MSYLVIPEPFTVKAVGSQLTTASAANLASNEAACVWRSAGLTDTYVVVECNQPVDTIALMFGNLRPTDTVRIRAAPTQNGTTTAPTYDSGTFPASTGTPSSVYTSKTVHSLPAATTTQFWRIDISAPAHPDGYVEMSSLVMGKKVQLGQGIGWDAVKFVTDNSLAAAGPNYTTYQEYPRVTGWRVSCDFIPDALWYNSIEPLLVRAGKTMPLLFVPKPYRPDLFTSDVVYGQITSDLSGECKFSDGWYLEMTITSLSA